MNSTKHTGPLLQTITWVILFWERLWPLLVPAILAICVFAIFTWTGGWHSADAHLHPVLVIFLKVLFGAGLLASLWPVLKITLPGTAEIIRRIEGESDLEDRPLTAQSDAMAMGEQDGFAAILWKEHQARMANRLEHMTSGAPAPKADRFDPFAIRAILPILAFAAFFFSFSPNGGKFSDFLYGRVVLEENHTRMDAWITPPTYTKKSPIYLKAQVESEETPALKVPANSTFFLRFVGSGDLKITKADTSGSTQINPKDGSQEISEAEFEFPLETDGVVRLHHEGEEISRWVIGIVKDQPPSIAFESEPRSALSGSLELSYSVKDDYGVIAASAKITPLEEQDPDARPLIEAPKVELPLPRHRAKSGKSDVNRDLTQHPWAGSRVTITLNAHDDAEQVGISQTKEIILPGRRFSKPLALALVEQRRILALDARKQHRVANLLDAVTTAPEEFIDNTNAFIGMKVAYRRIVDAKDDDDLRQALDLLWEIALSVEFGDLSDVEQRLREAQEALAKALENNASSEEIDRLMQDLRQAMNEMMQALAEDARRNPQDQNPFNPNDQSQVLSQNDLQKMMDRIEDLAKSGSQDAARQMLSELQRMMDNLRAGRHENQRQAEGNEFNQALDKLSELMQQQQDLMNETFRMQRRQQEGALDGQESAEQRQQNGNQQSRQQQQGENSQNSQNQQEGQNEQEQSGQMTPEEFADALRQLQEQQEALEKQLGQLGEQLQELGLPSSEELGEARNEMGEAGSNLGQGDAGAAAANQGQALDALRRGAQSMMEQMAGDRQQGGQQQSRRGGSGIDDAQRSSDPLGRKTGSDGLDADSGTKVPGEIDAQRARGILEAIRKRLSIPDNPLIENDYLERLLKSR